MPPAFNLSQNQTLQFIFLTLLNHSKYWVIRAWLVYTNPYTNCSWIYQFVKELLSSRAAYYKQPWISCQLLFRFSFSEEASKWRLHLAIRSLYESFDSLSTAIFNLLTFEAFLRLTRTDALFREAELWDLLTFLASVFYHFMTNSFSPTTFSGWSYHERTSRAKLRLPTW